MSEDEMIDKAWESLLKIDWKIHDKYGQAYLTREEFEKQMNNVSILRKFKGASITGVSCIKQVLRTGLTHHKELKEYLYNEPKRDAQKFIGNRKIRAFIFKRDGNICLRCGCDNKLSIDHIVAVSKGGKNRLYNLQTLCSSCNSWKSDKTIDFR